MQTICGSLGNVPPEGHPYARLDHQIGRQAPIPELAFRKNSVEDVSMGGNGGPAGTPRSLLADGHAWTDTNPKFSPGPEGAAATDVWRLANSLKRARQRRGMTQQALARKADISARSIQDLERGNVWPSLNTVSHVARCLGLKLSLSAIR